MDLYLKAKEILIENKAYILDYENLSKLLEYNEIILDKMFYKSLYLRYSKESKLVSLLYELEDKIESKDLINLKELIDRIVIEKSSIEDDTIGCLIKVQDEGVIPNIESKCNKLGYKYKKEGDILYVIGLGSFGYFNSDENNSIKFYVIKYKEKGTFDIKDVKIDLFHSDGAGGQNVNKVESGVRATHLLTNLVVTCKDERSQLFNKERAINNLKEKVEDFYQNETHKYIKAEIKKEYGKKI